MFSLFCPFRSQIPDELRYVGQKIRRGVGRTKGPAKRTEEDDERFEKAFSALLDREAKAC
jgi:uncharacterized protein YaiI (UPF0178 family)